MNKEFNLSERENLDGDGDYNTEDVKEAVRRLKERIDKQADEIRDKQERTDNNEVAFERLERANLIYGNNGVLEIINEIFGEKLC